MKSIYGALLCSGLLLAMPSAANAVVVISSVDITGPTSNGPVLDPDSTTGVFISNATASDLSGCPCYRSPFDGTAAAGSPFSSVSGGGTATYEIAGVANELQLLWGSPDVYNTIEFFLASVSQGSFLGTAIIPPVVGTNPQVGWGNVVFSGAFDQVVLRSDPSDAFEFANFNAVPIPAALPLFAGGLGLLGWLARRRRQPAEFVTA